MQSVLVNFDVQRSTSLNNVFYITQTAISKIYYTERLTKTNNILLTWNYDKFIVH